VKPTSTGWRQVYLCVGLTTLSTLILELSLTRIFSVVFYYHFAFLAISIALFGLAAGGILSYVVGAWASPLFTRLGCLSAANSFLVLLALGVILSQKNLSHWKLALVYFTAGLPFMVSGIIVSLAISETMERVDRVYLCDLLGAAAGCLLLIPLLNRFGGPGTVIAAAVGFAVAAAIWNGLAGSLRGRAGSVALVLALVALLAWDLKHPIDLHHAKRQTLANELFSAWNSFSRVAVVQQEGRKTIYIDADAATSIARFDFQALTPRDRGELFAPAAALPYALRPGARTLIIGPGGGTDVARALASGSHDVTAVEINPIIATTIMRERFPQWSLGLYLRPDVHVSVEDGRSFVRRSTAKYQVVQATFVDTWASTAAGAFALAENYLYTADAVRDYLALLSDDGVAAFTRWGLEPPRESLRMVSLAIEALRQLGDTAPWRHIIVGREGSTQGWGALDTVLISREPFSQTDIDKARTQFAAYGTVALYFPGSAVRNPFHDLLHSPNPDEYERNYAFDITPVTDNRPFFFYTVQPRDLGRFLRDSSHDAADYRVGEAAALLFRLMGVSLLATALILLLPPLLLGTRLPRQRGVAGFLPYFMFVGAGYILIEVGLIQKFVLFLGHPSYALTVVIFSLLAASGLGSGASRRIVAKDEARLMKVLGTVALLSAVLALVLTGLLSSLVWLPLPLKMALTIALITPLGFVMGMPFPVALKHLEEWHAPAVRWAWSLNAAASVLGAVGAVVCSIYLGLVQTCMIGGLFYVAALATVARRRRKAVAAPEAGAERAVPAR